MSCARVCVCVCVCACVHVCVCVGGCVCVCAQHLRTSVRKAQACAVSCTPTCTAHAHGHTYYAYMLPMCTAWAHLLGEMAVGLVDGVRHLDSWVVLSAPARPPHHGRHALLPGGISRSRRARRQPRRRAALGGPPPLQRSGTRLIPLLPLYIGLKGYPILLVLGVHRREMGRRRGCGERGGAAERGTRRRGGGTSGPRRGTASSAGGWGCCGDPRRRQANGVGDAGPHAGGPHSRPADRYLRLGNEE